jgi:hypothetical protein
VENDLGLNHLWTNITQRGYKMGNALKLFSIEDMEREIERRKELTDIDIPTPMETIDTKSIVRICHQYINEIVTGTCDHEDCDCTHYIFEATMKAVYGDNIFRWVNENI